MILVMNPSASMEDIDNVLKHVQKIGLDFSVLKSSDKTIIMTQPSYDINVDVFKALPKVEYVVTLNEDYKLVYKNINALETIVEIDDVKIGGKDIAVIAGPCAVEADSQVRKIATAVRKKGVRIFRAGAFKFRTNPYTFQGLGRDALRMLAELKEETDLKIVTEVLDYHDFSLVADVTDIIQIGARNMYNVNLLRASGEIDKPVLLKRSFSATLKEFLFAAEYILMGGNKNVILCERGIRTFTDYTRNTLDLSIVPAIKQRSHLPIIVDPSHATGKRDYIIPMSLAAIAAGADGLMIEVHHQPELAYSDADQAIRLEQFDDLMNRLNNLAPILGKKINIK